MAFADGQPVTPAVTIQGILRDGSAAFMTGKFDIIEDRARQYLDAISKARKKM